ncbi:unnamed protein product [Coregonus sp. 'balchen']|nr:unnamed protein product [Coregonus sp. 'balchen']
MEAKKRKRKINAKRSGEQGTDNDAGVEQLNSALSVTIRRTLSARSSPFASSTQATVQMVNMVQRCCDDHTNPVDQLYVESCIPPATEELMTIFEDMLDELKKEDQESAKLL